MLGGLLSKVGALFRRTGPVTDGLLDELEEALVEGDVSTATAGRLVDELRAFSHRHGIREPRELESLLREAVVRLLRQVQQPLVKAGDPFAVYLMVGVNGTGKTTTIAKIAHRFQKQRKKPLLCAGDTFRAAAVEQLKVWGERLRVEVIAQAEGSDPGAVVFDSLRAARARCADVVLIDTAGRLHTKRNLMNEMAKIGRVIERELGRAAEETLIVLDATTGQNALRQVEEFRESVPLTGVVLAKLDGTAKGGIIISIAEQFSLPVKLVGTGERLEDLEEFDPREFTRGLFV